MFLINQSRLISLLLLSRKNRPALLQGLQQLIANTDNNTSLLICALQQQDFTAAKTLLHHIRGSFATLGADALAQHAKELELACTSECFAVTEPERFIKVYHQTVAELKAFTLNYSANDHGSNITTDTEQILQLQGYLSTQNMDALVLTQQLQLPLSVLMGPESAAKFTHQVAILDFTAAEKLLQPYLITNKEIPG